MNIGAFRSAIVAAHPHLAGAEFNLLAQGWDSIAVDVDDRLIFKFPRHAAAEKALIKEARLLAWLRPAVTMNVPAMTIHAEPVLHSRHEKIAGDHLVTDRYERLPEHARRRVADEMSLFYAELHRLGPCEAAAAGAEPLAPWLSPDDILRKALPALPARLRPIAERTVAAWRNLPPDPHGVTYGFFDGHGWNMAFDLGLERLNGIYDFADSGIGPLHQEFVYSSMISPDLTSRIVASYESRTGLALDRERIAVLTGAHRLSELAEFAQDPAHTAEMVAHAAEWLTGR